MKMNNKGFSLVELIVVMAIMLIGITTAFNVFAYQNNTNARRISETLLTEFNQVRTDSMAYAAAWQCRIHVKTDSDGQTYFQVFKQVSDPTTGQLVYVTYDDDSDATTPEVPDMDQPVFDYTAPYREVCLGSEVYKSTFVVGSYTSKMTFTSAEAEDFKFSFKKSTGGIDKVFINDSDAGYTEYVDALSTGNSFATLTIETDSGKKSTLKFYFVTGRVEII